MAVDVHPSRKPTLPRKPPATSTTDGNVNTVGKTGTGGAPMEYGAVHRDLKVVGSSASERAHDFMASSGSTAKAPSPGKAAPNEGGTAVKASKPGDQS